MYVYRPKAIYLDTIEALLKWTPGSLPYDLFNISAVPLRMRPSIPEGIRVMHCNDFMRGYVEHSDMWPQGSTETDIYNFPYWQYVDIFCYFSHHRISIPTTWWTNCGHQNGVPILGTIMFEGQNPVTLQQLRLMLDDVDLTVNKLTKLAHYYGFEGWFFNIEHDLPKDYSSKMVTELLKKLKSNGMIVHWYDAVDVNGKLEWQNCLNEKNKVFFENSDAFFSNYWWGTQDLQTSVNTAKSMKRSVYDVYTGIDIIRGQPKPEPGYEAIKEASRYTSLGLFAPGCSFEHAIGEGESHHQNYEAKDHDFWIGNKRSVASVVNPRPIPAILPFGTNFDRGRGLKGMMVRGVKCSEQSWSNLSLQSLLPTHQFLIVSGKDRVFNIGFDEEIDHAYDGGASLKIYSDKATASDTVSYALYDFNIKLDQDIILRIVFKPLATVYPNVNVQLYFDDGSDIFTNMEPIQENRWFLSIQRIKATGKTLKKLHLVIGPSKIGTPGANYGVLIGSLSIYPDNLMQPQSVSNLKGWILGNTGDSSQPEIYLSWEYPEGQARFFDIWMQKPYGQWQWMVRVCANAAWISYIESMAVGLNTVTIGVQPVNFGHIEQSFEQIAKVKVKIKGNSFDDTGTAGLSSSLVTGGTIF